MKILVCDDSVINRQIIGGYLQQMGHKAIYADNGQQAIELFTKNEPDLVLIDVEMPGMDGYEATKAIRQSCYDFSQWTPIIFVSSYIDDESIVKGIEAGADDYLTKPVSAAVLRAKIHAMRRLAAMRENLIDFGKQLREVNEKLMSSNQLLSELSLKDPLTRLGNRRAFEEALSRDCRTAIRENTPLCMLMVDVDNFKSFNDTYGHQAGDYCLQQVAQVLKQGLHRASDFAARYGGEEFAILLADTPFAGGLHVADRVRMGVEALQIQNKRANLGIVTISIGVACSKIESNFASDALVTAADAALYEAKEAGRNCVMGAKSLVDENVTQELLKAKKRRMPNAGMGG
ncbi:MAG: diguanylate cyclase [Candidatus Berkiella sp.]